jgi:transposase-like protein
MTTRKRYTPEEKAAILADAEATTITAAAAKHGVSPTSIINWRRGGSVKKSKAKPAPVRTRADDSDLKRENDQLRQLVVSQLIEIQTLRAREAV